MLQAVQVESVSVSEVYFLPQAFLAQAEKLLQEVRQLDVRALSLDILSIYHQELSWLVKNFPAQVHRPHILPELKSYRLAFACSIERRQNVAL